MRLLVNFNYLLKKKTTIFTLINKDTLKLKTKEIITRLLSILIIIFASK